MGRLPVSFIDSTCTPTLIYRGIWLPVMALSLVSLYAPLMSSIRSHCFERWAMPDFAVAFSCACNNTLAAWCDDCPQQRSLGNRLRSPAPHAVCSWSACTQHVLRQGSLDHHTMLTCTMFLSDRRLCKSFNRLWMSVASMSG